MPNSIFCGPTDRQPHTINAKTVAAALLPGTWVTEGATSLAQATAPGPMVRVLANRDFYSTAAIGSSNPLLTAYASGDTGIAYTPEPAQLYLMAAAAATYTFGQELTIAAAGRVAGGASTNIIVAFAREAGAKSAGDLMLVEIANFYTKP